MALRRARALFFSLRECRHFDVNILCAQVRTLPPLDFAEISSKGQDGRAPEECQSLASNPPLPGGGDAGGAGTMCSLPHQFTTGIAALSAATGNACTVAAGNDASKAVTSVSAERAGGAETGRAVGAEGDQQGGENAKHMSRARSSESNFSLLSTDSGSKFFPASFCMYRASCCRMVRCYQFFASPLAVLNLSLMPLSTQGCLMQV